MAEEDDRRVEPRQVLVGRGLGTTPERVVELNRQVEEVEKRHRAKPARSFSEVMAGQGGDRGELEEEGVDKEAQRQKLPVKGPRPGLSHPVHREVFGRGEETDDDIVLKG